MWHQALPSRYLIYIFKNSLEHFANLSSISQTKHSTLFYLLYPTGGHLVIYSHASSFGCVTEEEKVLFPDTVPHGHQALPSASRHGESHPPQNGQRVSTSFWVLTDWPWDNEASTMVPRCPVLFGMLTKHGVADSPSKAHFQLQC